LLVHDAASVVSGVIVAAGSVSWTEIPRQPAARNCKEYNDFRRLLNGPSACPGHNRLTAYLASGDFFYAKVGKLVRRDDR
jgi:hypothetical protein